MSSPVEDLRLVEAAARAAGALAMGFFRKDPRVWKKGNDSPVTEADMAVDRYLTDTLLAARPGYGWLSEETEDTDHRLQATRLFIVDPIDGTRAFVAGEEGWTICIAVVQAGRPIAAAVYCPPTDEMYSACTGEGSHLNGAPVRVSNRTSVAGADIAGPRNITGHDAFAAAGVEPGRVVRSLALRIALVAAGTCDAAVARPNAHDWDLAAADLLVHEAGGRLADADGEPLIYNRQAIRHPALVAAPLALQRDLGALVRQAVNDLHRPAGNRLPGAACGGGTARN